MENNSLAEYFIRKNGGCFLDSENFVWKVVEGQWLGKRSVWTFDNRACWLEDTEPGNVKTWWCGGQGADYSEIFRR